MIGAFLAPALGKYRKLASISAALSVVVGSAFCIINAIEVLRSGRAGRVDYTFADSLGNYCPRFGSALGGVRHSIGLIVSVAALYGIQYLDGSHRGMSVGVSWFFYNLLAASMLLVITARNGLFFLICWEIMSLVSFFLVISDYESESVRRAGWIYLVATHLGTACLFVLFLLLGRENKSLDFGFLVAQPGAAGVLFLLAVVGFGTKAGFMPFHVWLPEAHPAAPSHVSAVMSGGDD